MVPLLSDKSETAWLDRAETSALREFLKPFMALSLFFLAVVGVYHFEDAQRSRQLILNDEQAQLALAANVVSMELDQAVSLLRLLGRTESLLQALEAPQDSARLLTLARNLAVLLEESRDYDEIALVSPDGEELLHVNDTREIPSIRVRPGHRVFLPQSDLDAVAKLAEGRVYVSPPLLNHRERRSQWPAIILATPLRLAGSDAVRGILIITYPITTLTVQLDSILSHAHGHISLLGAQGEWLYDQQRSGSEWGYMLQPESSFARLHPDLWNRMANRESGSLSTPEGTYLFTSLHPPSQSASGRRTVATPSEALFSWKMISHLPPQAMRQWQDKWFSALPFYVLFLALSGFALWHRSQSVVNRRLVSKTSRLAGKAMDSRSAGMFVGDPEGRFLATNPAFLTLTGYTEQELLHQHKSVFPDMPRFWEEIRRAVADNGEWEGETSCRRKDGSVFPAWLAVNAVQAPGREITHMVGILSDITARKQAELALQESQERLRQIFHQAYDALYLTDMDGRIVDVNEQACTSLRMNREELLAKSVWDIDPDHNKADILAINRTMQPGVVQTFLTRHQRSDGTTFPVEVRSGLLTIGERHFILAIVRDITERVEAERALAESRARLARAQQIAQLGNWDWDMESGNLYWSDEVYRIFGRSPDRFENTFQSFLDTIHPEDMEYVMQSVNAALMDRKSYSIDHRILRPDGVMRVVHEQGEVVYDGTGRPVRMFDITERKQAEQSLRENEALLRTLINAMPDIVYLKDGEGRWLETNDFTRRLFQLENADYLGKRDAELSEVSPFHKDAFLTAEVSDGFAWESGQTVRGEEAIPQPDGSTKIFDIIKVPIFDPLERPKGLVVIGRDITERKRAEKSLRTSLETFSTVLDSMEAAVYVADMQNHEILFANRYTHEALGAGPGELVGRTCWEAMQKDQTRPCAFCTNNQLLTPDGQPGEPVVWEFRNTLTERWYHIHDSAIRWVDGRIARMEIATDITEMKKTEEALRESRANLNKAQEIAHVGNWEWLAETSVTRWSEEIYRIAGLPVPLGMAEEQSLPDETVFNVTHPQDRPALQEAREAALAGTAHYNLEFRVVRPSGEARFVHVMGEVLRNEHGAPVRMIGTIQDITERKQFEALQHKHQIELEHAARLSVIGEMASGLAHELSQPLSATLNYLRGCTRRLERGSIRQEELLDILKLAATQTERAGDIIAHLKEFARKREPVRTPLNIHKIIREVIGFLELELRRGKVSVSLVVSDPGMPPVLVDKVEVDQVLVNLMKNAIEAMQTAERREITVRVEQENDAFVRVEVSDTGPGIAPEHLETLFHPFFTTKAEGMGLGLAITHSIIEGYGGRMEVTSPTGGGACFAFTLPIGKENNNEH